ncbi:MAG: alpha/beta hydrolase [Taibaiella sp.]|nr:alpha/beta hydrolase [Taibaiella sp.]
MVEQSLRKNNVTVIEKASFDDTIIFAHGFGTDQHAWKDVVPAFENQYRIVLYDNVGGGMADAAAFSPNKYDNLYSYADDLLDICKALNINDAIMVGHSVSGMISLLAGNKEPGRFRKMVLVGASARYLDDENYKGGFTQEALNGLYQAMANNYYAWVSGFAPAAMANPDNPEFTAGFEQTLSAIRPDIALSVAKVIFQSDYRHELPKCTTETLLLQTKQDIAVPLEAAEYLHNNIRNSRLRVIEAEGHFPHISAPNEVITAIKEFI